MNFTGLHVFARTAAQRGHIASVAKPLGSFHCAKLLRMDRVSKKRAIEVTAFCIPLDANATVRLPSLAAIGVGTGFSPPLPPNRACGSPAHGSPVDSFFIEVGALTIGLYAW
uniref:Uncharacterized protein n=1 Tax=Candidatus Kentrum sp. LFY TaxID=2126342 RepID=A0A450V1V3_9GAMM|nr:MAG: hypothetical protein BECKLFY1418B_GA0070995_11282 [Candidatus Kentron sp. LFY]